MSAMKARLPLVILGLLFATASWLGAAGSPPEPAAGLATAPLAANSCPAAAPVAAAGGNCSDNSDCPGGYCYHDPIALVPYCVYGQVDTLR